MLELLNSLVRLSAAVTVLGMQEVQSAAGAVHPGESVEKLREMIDSMTNSLTSKINESKRPVLESFSRTGQDVVDQTVGRTMDTINNTMDSLNNTIHIPNLSPSEIIQNTSDAAKSTSDWLRKIVKPAAPTTFVVEQVIVEEEVIVVG